MAADLVLVPAPISAASYRPYGDVLSADREDIVAHDANQGTAKRKDWQIELAHDRPAARANFASFRCAPRTEWPMPILLLEKHPHSTQVFSPMTAGAYVVVVALGGETPDLATLQAFVVERGVAVSYRPGVWHHPMIAVEEVTDFACLVWEDGTAEDAVVHTLRGAHLALEGPSLSRAKVTS